MMSSSAYKLRNFSTRPALRVKLPSVPMTWLRHAVKMYSNLCVLSLMTDLHAMTIPSVHFSPRPAIRGSPRINHTVVSRCNSVVLKLPSIRSVAIWANTLSKKLC